MNEKRIKLIDIVINGDTQQRESINTYLVEEYSEDMKCGAKFPAIELFFDGAQYWLADGFHRYHAARSAEIPDLLANIHNGTSREARLYSMGANKGHGARPTNRDKRKSVIGMLSDREWSQWTDRAIAKHCGVTHPLVAKLRLELAAEVKVKSHVVTVTTQENNDNENNDIEDGQLDENEAKSNDIQVNETENYSELDAARDRITELQAEIVIAHDKDSTPDERASHAEFVSALMKENNTLKQVLSAIKSVRDGLQQENAELKNQIKIQRKQIEKLTKNEA